MSYEGEVRDGTIVLTPPVKLPEGAKVQVLLRAAAGDDRADPTLYDQLRELDGVLQGMPADFAAEHDHYIHGTPKRNG